MSTKYTVVPTPQSNEELKQWIQDWIGFVNEASNETLGVSGTTLRKPKRDHGHPSTWNTELITDMSDLFFRNEWGDTTFNEDISSWDTSNVINMRAVRPVEKDNVSKQTHQHLHFHYSFHNYSFHTIHS
jgi:surface protein